MSNIDKQALREAAANAKIAGEAPIMPFDQRITALNDFMKHCTPATVLALLDELEAKDKRIAELEARKVNLPRYCVAKVMLLSGFDRQYAEGWCAGNDNAIHEIHLAGVKVAAAAGKGE
ncbi:ead/Ea22-like family protein [Enterobacter kobei]|jgi:hypothetical protein|nr:ead/Ea22-like family protein [Enterobacter kobei]